jgi:branched-chain amino acid transport system substrate-binding protein
MQRRQFINLGPKLALAVAAPSLSFNTFAQDGLSAKTITIGSTGALSGPLAGFGVALQLGVQAAMTQINAKGGVNGRQLQFQLIDDAYAPERSLTNVKKMVADSSVFALLSCIGTPNNAAILPMVEEAGLPYVAPLTGASSLRKAGLRNVFHVRASYTDETQRLVDKLVSMNIKDLAIVYLDNAFGKEVLADAQKALTANNVKSLASVALATDGKNLADVVNQVMAAKPAAVLLGTAGAASASLIAALKVASPLMPIAGLSVALTADGLKQLGAAAQGVALTMVFPNPNSAKLAVARNYQAAMRAINQTEFTQGGFEGYINTLVLAEGIERSGRDITRAKLRGALAGLSSMDVGGLALGFTGTPYVASKFVDLGVVGAGGRLLS